jgi:choline dehydrogenase
MDKELLARLCQRASRGQIERRSFLRLAGAMGLQAAFASALADSVAAAPVQERHRSIEAGYDYIVVGSGSAGSVVASRLAAGGQRRVLLVEAGTSDLGSPHLSSPFSWPANIGSDVDWGYKTVPQVHADNRVFNYPRGKVIGGSSSINAMIWTWGHASDFDQWEKAGCTGWAFDSVQPLFRKIENCATGAGGRGHDGPMHVGRMPVSNPLNAAFFSACADSGLSLRPDINAPVDEGCGLMDLSIRDGRRFSVVHGYLLPALKHHNLTLLTDARAEKLIFEGTRCQGVRLRVGGQLRDIRADRETIVCAGAIDSPRLLMLSGVGSADELRGLGIPGVLDLPGVGQNLQDHVALSAFVARSPTKARSGTRLDAHAFLRTRGGKDAIDAQLLAIPGVLPPFPLARDEGYTFWGGLVRPQSRGRVKLLSAAPDARLHIDPAYLAEPADHRALMVMAERCRELGLSSAYAPFRAQVIHQAPVTRGELASFVRQNIDSYWHPTSTCAMGTGRMAVVDPQLRVRGSEGLRVADASIMPSITSANTNAPSIMIGEKAAQLLGA